VEDKREKLDPCRKPSHLKVFDEDQRKNTNRSYMKSPPNLKFMKKSETNQDKSIPKQ
jgi:hypothetical protein